MKKKNINAIMKIVRNKRLLKEQVDLLDVDYCVGYTDAINDILYDLNRLLINPRD